MGKKVKQQKKRIQKEESESEEEQQQIINEEQEEELNQNIEQEEEIDEQLDQELAKEEVINKEQIMKQKIQEIQSDFKKRLKLSKKEGVNWHEHMSLISDDTIELQKMDINDDIQREVQFYNIALENVKLAVKYLESENIPIRRPDDYFADMFKNDKQMAKIKSRLVAQQVKVQNFEERQLREQSKKLHKKIKARTEFKKQEEKRSNLQAIEKWKDEIKNKGEKARDLSDFMLSKQNLNKNKQSQNNNSKGGKPKPQQYSKYAKNSGGGKKAKFSGNNNNSKGGQNNKINKQGKVINKKGTHNKKRPGKSSRGGSSKKKGKRGHQ